MDEDLERILDEARAGGRAHSVGRFSVDRVREADLLRRKRMVDPHAWVLKAVQAAAAGGATRVRVAVEAHRVLVTHDAPPLAREELEGLLAAGSHHRATARERALHHLAVGLEACLALKPLRMALQSGEHRLRVDGGGEARIEEAPSPLPSSGETHLVAAFEPRGPRLWGRWLSHQVRRLGGRRGGEAGGALRPEFHLVEERCRYAPLPVLLDGWAVNRPYFGLSSTDRPVGDGPPLDLGRLPRPRHRKEMFLVAREGALDLVPAPLRGAAPQGRRLLLAGADGPGEEATPGSEGRFPGLRLGGEACSACYAALARGDRSWSETLFVQDGVVVWAERNLMDRPGLLAVLSCRGLSVDLSEFAIVHDDAFHRRIDHLRKVALWMY